LSSESAVKFKKTVLKIVDKFQQCPYTFFVDKELLQERAAIIRKVRRFFDDRDYLEVDTPLLAPDLIPESCLEVFETAYIPPNGSRISKRKPYYLVPSPEIWMKKLIAGHRTSIYQICRCFRNGESVGRLHSPEFTMLEYYTLGADYKDSIAITEELFGSLLPDSARKSLRPPFLRLSVDEAFSQFAGFSLLDAVEKGVLEDEARKLGIDLPKRVKTPVLYDLIFIHVVEPNLPRDRPVVLMDYPAFVPCLAKKAADGKTAERWELYVRGIELANCYSEETNPDKVRAFFEEEEAAKTKAALVKHNVDENYWKTFLPKPARNRYGNLSNGSLDDSPPYPLCSGVALGMDRLIMSLTGKSSIDSVLPFPMSEPTRW
jgi:lysyl-tRNA synthetase class 2